MLAGLPDTTAPANTNNYTTLQEFTADYDKANGKIDLQATPTMSLFGRYGFRNLNTFDQPTIPLPSGGAGNGAIYARNRQAVFGDDLDAERVVAARSAVRLFVDAGRQEPAGARQRQRAGAVRPAGAAERPAHLRRPADASSSPAIPISAARRPIRSGSIRRSTTRR